MAYLQAEIEICIKEDFTSQQLELLTPEYIVKQNNKIVNIIEHYPELALLKLGKLAELFLLQALELKRKPEQTNLAWMAKNEGLLTNQEVKIFDSIRKENNALKHRVDYSVNKTKIDQLWKNFSSIIHDK